MSIIITYPFTNPANYTLSNAAVSGGTGKLSLEDKAGLISQQAFSADTGFTYDSAKTEFSAGVMRAKAQNPYLSAGNLLITVPDADSKDITDLLTAI